MSNISIYLIPIRKARKSLAHIAIHDGIRGVIAAMILYFTQFAVRAIEANTIEIFWRRTTAIVALVFIKFIIQVGWKPLVFHEFRKIHMAILSYTFPKLIKSDHNACEKIGTGKMISLFLNGVNKWLYMSIDLAGEVMYSVVFFLIFLITIASKGWYAFLALIIALTIVGIWLYAWHDNQFEYRKKSKDEMTQAERKIVRWIQSRVEVLQHNKIAYELDEVEKVLKKFSWYKVREKIYQGFAFDGAEFFLTLGFVASIMYTGSAIAQGTMNYSDMVLVVSMGSLAVSEIAKLTFRIRFANDQWIDIVKLIEMLQEVEAHRDYSHGKKITLTQGEITLENISFSYDRDNPVIEGLDLYIKPKETIALVGPSGGGKSTVMKLIAGYLFPQKGAIMIDTQKIGDLSLLDWYQHVGYLTQDPSIFDGTVRENLLYGVHKGKSLSDDILLTILDKAQCHFVSSLPHGLETEIGERGVRLSGGQRQRLAIAKIMLKNPEIILLDEPTSALDSLSEELITKAMNNLFMDRTVVIIAHRLQTVKHADRILYIDHGRIVETGTHDQLVKEGGKYAKMVELQTGF